MKDVFLKVFTAQQFTHCDDKEFQSLILLYYTESKLSYIKSKSLFKQLLVVSSSTAVIHLKYFVNIIVMCHHTSPS